MNSTYTAPEAPGPGKLIDEAYRICLSMFWNARRIASPESPTSCARTVLRVIVTMPATKTARMMRKIDIETMSSIRLKPASRPVFACASCDTRVVMVAPLTGSTGR